jgi:hypothetical protein
MQQQKGEVEIKFDTMVSRISLQDEKLQSPSTMQLVPLGLCTGKCPVFNNLGGRKRRLWGAVFGYSSTTTQPAALTFF